MSTPDEKDKENGAADAGQKEAAAEGLSGRPVGPRFHDVAVLLSKEDFDRILSSRLSPSDEEPSKPTTPDELRAVLLELDGLGWEWNTDDPPALMPKPSANPDPATFKNLSKKYPAFPEELAGLIKYALWGWPPRQSLVGPSSDLPAKVSIISELVLTEDYRSEFFFQHATRLRRFHDLDWEVMIKAAERNITRVPATVYANLSLETSETQPF